MCPFQNHLMPSLVADTVLKFYHLQHLVGYISYRHPCSRTFCLLVKKMKRQLVLQMMEGNSSFTDVSRCRILLLESQLSHKYLGHSKSLLREVCISIQALLLMTGIINLRPLDLVLLFKFAGICYLSCA